MDLPENPQEERSRRWAEAHLAPETVHSIEIRREICRDCSCCLGFSSAITVQCNAWTIFLTEGGSCPLKKW